MDSEKLFTHSAGFRNIWSLYSEKYEWSQKKTPSRSKNLELSSNTLPLFPEGK